LTGGYTGTETNVSYKWNVRDPNGTTIDSGSLTNNSQTTSTTFTPTILEYISLEITTAASATNIESRIIDVVHSVVVNNTVKTSYNTGFELRNSN
jgi:phosphoribosylformylglycinamidine (FGAM) synthase PurS component